MSDHPRWHLTVLALSALIAAVVARPYAGGWNDGSRLATVESLVDRGDWAVDDSIFVVPGRLTPYAPDDAANETGTRDLLVIGGNFYSDKSPTPALFMAAEYAALQHLTGWTARTAPARFCYWMTLGSSGLAYVVAVWCVFRLGRPLDLSLTWRFLMTASFALATVAPTYAAQVNNHILLLAVAAALCVELAWLARDSFPLVRFAVIGALTGLGYTIDLGVGPVLTLATAAFVVSRYWRRPAAVLVCGIAALPFFLLHHALNYSIGGTFAPANSVADYLTWPGSPFTAQNMTGGWNHPSATRFVLYSLDMLFGKRGLLCHNLTLALIPAAVYVSRGQRQLVIWALGWSAGAWLLYAATSTNSSGVCCSIRWLVPLIAPAYLLIAFGLRDRPNMRPDFLLLSAWGMVYSGFMLAGGPWREVNATANWLIVGGAALSWVFLRLRKRAATTEFRTRSTRAAA